MRGHVTWKESFILLLTVLVAGLASAATDPRAVLMLADQHFDAFSGGMEEQSPCGPVGDFRGRCLTPPNDEKTTFGDAPADEGPGGFEEARLDARIESISAIGPDTRIAALRPEGQILFGPQPAVTSCGAWDFEVVVDPASLQPSSEIVLQDDPGSSSQGVVEGVLTVHTTLRFMENGGALIVERPFVVELELAGRWEEMPSLAGGGSEWLLTPNEDPGAGCWGLTLVAGSLVFTYCQECESFYCTEACSDPFCEYWCQVEGEVLTVSGSRS